MKNNYQRKLVFLYVGFIFNLVSIAGNCKTLPARFSATFTVVVEDYSLINKTKLIFKVQQSGINTNYPGFTNDYSLSLSKPVTRIKLPLSTSINYLKINQYKNDLFENDRLFDESNGVFIVQNGDSIQIHIGKKREKVHFGGRGAEKYNCQYQLGNQTSFSVVKYNEYVNMKNYRKAFESGKFQHDSIFAIQKLILEKYKSKIDKRIYNLMLLDWNSYKSQRIAELFYIPFRLHQTEYLPSAREMFEENFHALPGKDNESSDDRIKSYRFADFSIALLKMKIVIESMNSEQQYILQVPFLIIDSAINHLYKKGIFKDKIMLLAFLSIDRNEQTNYMNFLDKAIRGATSGQFKKQLTAFRAKNNKGSLAFPFHFADTNGKEHRLSEFAGKLVVMDFWFTGCKGCLQMAPVLRSLAKELKVNPDIVFISVSIDRNSTVWKQSVAKGLYCSLDEVNLLSDNGSSSKILQHYNINSFPTLILISKSGRIVSTTPPDPRLSRQKFDALLMNNL